MNYHHISIKYIIITFFTFNDSNGGMEKNHINSFCDISSILPRTSMVVFINFEISITWDLKRKTLKLGVQTGNRKYDAFCKKKLDVHLKKYYLLFLCGWQQCMSV